jgi:hypothetical protein
MKTQFKHLKQTKSGWSFNNLRKKQQQ